MRIGIVTIKRPHCYLPELLASLPPKSELDFFVGTPDVEHIKDANCYQIHVLPAAVKDNHGTSVNSVVNHAQAYLHCNTVLEDDVIVSSKFETILEAAVTECYRLRPNGHFILSLASHNQWPKGSLIVPYPLDIYYGTQGIYVPSELQFDIFHYFIRSLIECNHLGTDCVLADYCRNRGISLFCTTSSIVKHIGEQSAFSDERIVVDYPDFVP